MAKHCILVTGMHRSGTSLYAGIFNLLGAEVGITLAPKPGVNEKGYFENKKIVRNNQYLLEHLGMSWDSLGDLPKDWRQRTTKYFDTARKLVADSFSKDIFCLKDPRFCSLLPMWDQIFRGMSADVTTVFCVRNPNDVVSSLVKRDDMSETKAELLWKKYNNDFLNNLLDRKCIFSHYDNMIDDPEKEISRIMDFVGRDKLTEYDVVKKDLLDFVTPSLRHNRSFVEIKNEEIKGLYNNLVGRCYV